MVSSQSQVAASQAAVMVPLYMPMPHELMLYATREVRAIFTAHN